MGTRRQRGSRGCGNAHINGYPTRLGAIDRDRLRGRALDSIQTIDFYAEPFSRLGRIHDLQTVDVFDLPILDLPRQSTAIPNHVDAKRRSQGQARHECRDDGKQYHAIDQHSGSEYPCRQRLSLASGLHRILRIETDEPARVLHFVHHAVAHIDARRAADALILQAISNIDACWAHLNAQPATDAVPFARR